MLTQRPKFGRAAFYHRDSEGRSDLAPHQYVRWTCVEAAKLKLEFGGTPEQIESMIKGRIHAQGDLYIDYGVSGNLLSRPGFDAFRQRARTDRGLSHLFFPARDRFCRPDNPLEPLLMEYELRADGITLVTMKATLPPIPVGGRIDLSDLLVGLVDYDVAGRFRDDLANKLIQAKIKLAEQGFSIGGEPLYGFRRYLCSVDGTINREIEPREIAKKPGHHVIWLPTGEAELEVVHRILDLIETTPAARIARILNAEGIPAPKAGQIRHIKGVPVENQGLWTQNTVTNIAKHPLLMAMTRAGHRSMGTKLRFTPSGPRPLGAADYRESNKPGESKKPKNVTNSEDQIISVPSRSKSIITPEKHARIKEILADRGRHLKGKARTRGNSPNPLGGRIYDLKCGWPMYRYARRKRWCYTCALYQNSEAKCCRHNVVLGAEATRFLLNFIQDRALNPVTLAKITAHLSELAAAEQGEDIGQMELQRFKAELTVVKRRLEVASENLALAETEEEREATRGVFRKFKAEESRLQSQIANSKTAPPRVPAHQEVEAALEKLDHWDKVVKTAECDYVSTGELFLQANAKLYLSFHEISQGRRKVSVPAGGIVTVGSAPPPIPLYEGPTDRVIIRQMLAKGLPVSPILQHGVAGKSEPRTEAKWSANVQRSTMRCI